MITFRTSADVSEQRQVVLQLPPETPTGKAELRVTVASVEPSGAQDSLRNYAGAIRSGDARSADNDRIDTDLARAYGDSDPEAG